MIDPLLNLSVILVRALSIVMTVVFWYVLGLGRYQDELGETVAVARGENKRRGAGDRVR